MRSARPYDTVFFALAMILGGVGIFILTSASLGLSIARFGNPYQYALHQILFGIVPGVLALYICSRIPYRTWKQWALPFLIASIFLMFLVFVPGIGFYYGGARRWISLGPISFQPSELLKLSFIIYLASWLETRAREVVSFKFGLLPFAIMSAFIASFLVFQPDIGTLLVLLLSAIGLFFLSGGAVKQLASLVLVGIIILGVLIVAEPYRRSRIKVFLNRSEHTADAGYQINQALIAIGSGGTFGQGFGLSRQKFSYLPEPMGDSIFAVFAEEVGFVGSTLLLVIFLLFFQRGMKVAEATSDLFGKLLGFGIMLLFIFQVLINVGAIIGLMPLTGIPLSFVSYGGSALLIMLAQVGIMLSISRSKI